MYTPTQEDLDTTREFLQSFADSLEEHEAIRFSEILAVKEVLYKILPKEMEDMPLAPTIEEDY